MKKLILFPRWVIIFSEVNLPLFTTAGITCSSKMCKKYSIFLQLCFPSIHIISNI